MHTFVARTVSGRELGTVEVEVVNHEPGRVDFTIWSEYDQTIDPADWSYHYPDNCGMDDAVELGVVEAERRYNSGRIVPILMM